MQPSQALFINAAVYALLHFWILPVVQAAWNRKSLNGQVDKAPRIILLEKLEQLSLMAAIAFGSFSLLILLLGVAGSTSFTVAAMLKFFEAAEEFFKHVAEIWSGALFVLVFLVFGYFWFRTMRRQSLENIAESVRQEAARVMAGKAERLQPTSEMLEILRRIQMAHLELESVPAGQPGSEASRATLLAKIGSLQNAYLQRDLERRLHLKWQTSAVASGPWPRARGFLLSQGVFSRSKGIGAVLSYMTTALMFAALIGFESGPLQATLEARTVKLRDLRVNLAIASAEREFKGASSGTASPTAAPTTQQRQALQQLAKNFSHSFAKGWNTGAGKPSSAAERAEWARWATEQKLANDSSKRPGPAGQKEATASNSWTSQDGAALHDYERATADPSFSSPLEDQFLRDAIKDGLHNEPRVAALAKENPFETAVFAGDLQDFEVEQALGGVFESISENVFSSDLARAVAKTASEYFKTYVTKVYKSSYAKFTASLLKTGDVNAANNAAYNEVRNLVFRGLRTEFADLQVWPEKDLAAKLHEWHPPAATENPGIQNAEQALEDFPNLMYKGREVSYANLLSNYDTEFPFSNSIRTARDQILSAWQVPDSNSVAVRASRALAFDQLQSYSRVGGILFGRTPPNDSTIRLTGLTWSKDTSGYLILLKTPDGDVLQLGRFSPYLVRQAMEYAADGRPTILTMMNGDPIGRKASYHSPGILPYTARLPADGGGRMDIRLYRLAGR